MNGSERRELLRLVSQLCDEQLDGEDFHRLESMLRRDARHRADYLNYMDMHARLMRCPPRAASGAAPQRLTLMMRYALVAAVVLCASLAVQLLLRSGPPPAVSEMRTAPAAYVATLVRAADCRWEGRGAELRVGARLTPGEISLAQGIAELRFDGGSQLIVHGPMRLRIDSRTSATVLTGTIVFRSDLSAERFDLRTPHSQLVNFGTEYGVSVGRQSEEVHVFDGRVQRLAADDRAPSRPADLHAGQARRFGPHTSQDIHLAPDRFVRSVPQPVSSADLSQGLLAYEGFDYELPALEASVDSDFVPGATGGSGWAGGWYMAPGVDPMRLGAASLSRGVDVRPGGRIDFAGTSTAGRAMEMAVRMDRDGLYYFSFLFRRQANEDASATDAFMFYLREAGNQTDSSRMLALGVAGAEHLLFVNFRGGGQRVPLPLEYGHTYLLAGKIVAAAWGPDQVFIRVYRTDEPITLQEPASWTLVTQPVVSEEVLDVLSIHVRSLAGESLDELRFAATWAAAVAPWAGPAEYAAQSGGAD